MSYVEKGGAGHWHFYLCWGNRQEYFLSEIQYLAVILFIEIEARRAAGGRGKERASIGQAGIERGWCEEGRSTAPLNCSVPGRSRRWRREWNAWREDVRWTWACCGVATHRECAKELTLRCAAEVTDVSIPVQVCRTISDQEFETFWPLAIFYHNRYTLGLQILYSYEYVSHEHEYIFYFFIVQLWKLTEASQSSKAIVSGDWNDCHIEVTSNCQSLIGWMLLTSAFGVHIWSAQNHACHTQ